MRIELKIRIEKRVKGLFLSRVFALGTTLWRWRLALVCIPYRKNRVYFRLGVGAAI